MDGLTPTLDRLADEGLRLTRAYAPAPLTLPSHASMLTAVPPPVHGLRANGLFRLRPDRPTLATVLHDAGYETAAFVGAFVLDARFGLNRGFDVYDDRYGERRTGGSTDGAERRADEVIAPALRWLLDAPRPRPWFVWIHLYDPHEPYRAPEPYASRYPPYDAEVAYTDAQIGKLLDALRTAGALDATLVVAAADHGESLGEHGERTHGVFVYESTMRVPWVLWAGSRLRGASDSLVRLVDLAPTALDLLDVKAPDAFAGTTVLTRLSARRDAATAYIEAMDANLTRNWAPLAGLVADRYKFIDLPVPELYDLASDPGEANNLYSSDPERARALDALLRKTTEGFRGASSAERTTLSAESRARLQALGYVSSSAAPAARTYTDADDPKHLIAASNELNDALAAFRRGAAGEATAAVRRIISAYPGFTTAYGVLASMQREAGDLRGAIATIEEVVRSGAADQSVLVVLGGYLREAGQLDRAADVLEAVVESHPDYAEAYNTLGIVYSARGQHDRARAALRKVVELDPTAATAYENLGVDEIAAGDTDAAIADLTRALAIDPDLAGAHNALAVVFARRHELDRAVEHWKRAVDLNPRMFDALYNVGTTLAAAGRRAEARPYLERFAGEAPPYRYAADIAKVRRMLAEGG